jgi:hypothetical protein
MVENREDIVKTFYSGIIDDQKYIVKKKFVGEAIRIRDQARQHDNDRRRIDGDTHFGRDLFFARDLRFVL